MSFHEKFIYNASKFVEVKSVEADFKYTKDLILKAISRITTIKINPSDVDIYTHGSYPNDTNIFFPSNLEVCVELKVPEFEYQISREYYISHDLPYGPREFRDDLYEAMRQVTAENEARTQLKAPECTKYAKCIVLEKYKNLKHSVEILPCVSFKMVEINGIDQIQVGKTFQGVLFFDESLVTAKNQFFHYIATFPKVHQRNGQLKDEKTAGNFKQMVRLFKTIKYIAMREGEYNDTLSFYTRGYFIECLLFNVPSAIYRGETQEQVFLKILNYLRHVNLRNFVCQNMVWYLFGEAKEFWNERDAEKLIKAIRIMYEETDPDRTTLA
ncbi:MAG: hypothetical protein FWC00_05585 [Firmicutes bacterium]|nr:hypothetical protein [Bacillota bacterium]